MTPIRYRNPVIPGFHPDPSVCRVGNDFYLVNSSFEFFPGIPIYHSTNLVDWELVAHAWTRKSQFDMAGAGASRGLFAPTIRFQSGEFFITVTNVSGTGNCILRSGKIEGPWSDPVPVAQGGIDPSLFFDDDGQAYFCSNAAVDGKDGIALSVINPVTGELRSPIRHIAKGSGGRWPEGPHVYKFHGLYYLVLSEGGTEYGHMVTLFRSASVWGPYTACPNNPVLTHRDDYRNPIQCTGHADIVCDALGNAWAVCLGARPLPGTLLHNTGRETFLAPVHWDDKLWFTIGDGGTISTEMEGPLPSQPLQARARWSPDFPDGGIDPEWNFVRNQNTGRFTFDPTSRAVGISGGKETLSETEGSPSFIGRRQEETECVFRADVTLAAAGGEAGIAAYYSDSYHYEMFLRRADGVLHAVLRRKIHDLEAETADMAVTSAAESPGEAACSLRIRGDRDFYHFEWKTDGEWVTLGTGMTAGLCTEGTYRMSFTGTYLGLFAVNAEARFTDIFYENAVSTPPQA